MAYTVTNNPWSSQYNVGIGTDAPTGKLFVVSASLGTIYMLEGAVGGAPGAGTGMLNVTTNQGGGKWATQMRADSGTANGLFVRAGADSSYYTTYMTGYDENNVHMVVRGDGNVGIGTTSPDRTLHIYNSSQAEIKLNTSGASDGGLIYYNDSETQFLMRAQETDGNITFQTGGTTERMRITSAGNIGIGTTNPGRRLTVFETATNVGAARFYASNASYTDTVVDIGTEAESSSTGLLNIRYGSGMPNTAFRVNADGNVGIGTTAPAASLQIESGSATQVKIVNTGTASGRFMVGNDTHLWISTDGANRDINFATNTGTGLSNERMTVTDDGVGIGTTSPGYKLEVNGTFYSAGSSATYKENIKDLEVDSSLIHSLRAVSYDYKKEYKDFGYNVKDGKQMGLISEEVAETIPELAIMKDGRPKNVDYQKLAVVLLAEVQNLKKDIEELKS